MAPGVTSLRVSQVAQSIPWPEPSTAPETGQALRRFRITHPFHPLRGREFELIQIKLCWGIDRVYYTGEDGALRHVPVGWTSVATTDPFVSVARGRSAFRVEDLLALAEAIARAL